MPFANYKDFDDCTKKNSDKENPGAYCGAIKKKTEGESMNTQEKDQTVKFYSIKTGDRVTKGGKDAQVISVGQDTAVILNDSGIFEEVPLTSLKSKESIFSTYLNSRR